MKMKELNSSMNTIRKVFEDERKIVSSVKVGDLKIDCEIPEDHDIFITANGDFIYLELQQENFTEEELAKFIGFAEELYEKYGQDVAIYILCPKNIDICVREFKIFSEGSFTIKLACINEDPCQIILDEIKDKIRANQMLDKEDLVKLAKLRKWCKAEDRNYYLMEYIRIVNRLGY